MDCRETKRTLLPGETVRVSDADVEEGHGFEEIHSFDEIKLAVDV